MKAWIALLALLHHASGFLPPARSGGVSRRVGQRAAGPVGGVLAASSPGKGPGRKRPRPVDLPPMPGLRQEGLRADAEARAGFRWVWAWETRAAMRLLLSLFSCLSFDLIIGRRTVDSLLQVDSEEPARVLEIMSKQADFLLACDCPALMSEMLEEEGNPIALETIRNVFDFMLSFLEEYVQETSSIESRHQRTVRQIIDAARSGSVEFNEKMLELNQKGEIDYGVLKYLDGEAQRLQSEGPGSRDLLGIIQIIRTRVATEIEESMGASASTLSRLLAFDDRYLMRAALRRAFDEMGDEGTRESFFKLAKATLRDLSAKPDPDSSMIIKLGDVLTDMNAIAGRMDDSSSSS
jgi:hypothetical protein